MYEVEDLPAGTYSFTARALDDSGATKTSEAVTVTVNSSTPNQPPVAVIVTPGGGDAFLEPAQITIYSISFRS